MAIGVSILEVRHAGSDVNSGGFAAGASGTDYSQQAAFQYSFADLASTTGTGASPAVTSVSHSFVAADVGNWLYVSAGTSWLTGYYQIVSAAGGAATLDRACGSAATLSSGTWVVGGAFGSPGQAGLAMAAQGVAGNAIYIKSDATYTLTNTTVNTSAGPVQMTLSGTAALSINWIGYQTTRGDNGAAPTISAGAQTTLTLFGSDATHVGNLIQNITVDGNSGASTKGFSDNTRRHFFYACTAKNCTNSGFVFQASVAFRCQAAGCTTQPAFVLSASCACFGCEAHDGTSVGFSSTNYAAVMFCLAYNNSGASSHGFSFTQGFYTNCVAYNNGGDGFRITNGELDQNGVMNCVAEKNGGFGFGAGGALRATFLLYCAAGSDNTSGGFDSNLKAAYRGTSFSYTSSAFTNPGGSPPDFSLNNLASQGASLRAAGFPGTLPNASAAAGFMDIGALQHRDPAFSSGFSS